MNLMNKIITTDITDPYLNLAIENDLLINTKPGQRHLFQFINRPCVVIGRFQNPWIECNLKKMQLDEIALLRRQSGGGTVYHDQNNINFSFIADKELHCQKYNHELVVKCLKELGVLAYATERGDIRLDANDKKISGSAFKQKKSQAFHHGTMLVTTDLELLNEYISSDKQDLETKSIASVRSKVANISEIKSSINTTMFMQMLSDVFQRDQDYCEHIFISKEQVLSDSIIEYANELRAYNWKFSETPKFVCESLFKTKQGEVSIELVIRKTKIESISLESQEVHPILLNEIESLLLHNFIEINEIEQINNRYTGVDREFLKEVLDWFKSYFNLKIIHLV